MTYAGNYSGASIQRSAKGLAKSVRYDEVSLYQGCFSYILRITGRRSFVIPTFHCNQWLLYYCMSESVDGQNESNPELWFSTWAGKPLAYSWFRVLVLKKNTIVAAHTWTGLNVSFVRFYIFIDLDFVSVGKNGPKKELDQYPVPSVGTVAQITYNIRNDWAKQYSPQENSIFGFLYFFCDEVTCRWPVSSHLELTLGQKQL